MSKLEWGKKHICSDCSTKFYDMNKPTPECPNCGSQVLISRKPRVGRPPLSKKIPEKPKVIPDLKKNITSEVITKKNSNNTNCAKQLPLLSLCQKSSSCTKNVHCVRFFPRS